MICEDCEATLTKEEYENFLICDADSKRWGVSASCLCDECLGNRYDRQFEEV